MRGPAPWIPLILLQLSCVGDGFLLPHGQTTWQPPFVRSNERWKMPLETFLREKDPSREESSSMALQGDAVSPRNAVSHSDSLLGGHSGPEATRDKTKPLIYGETKLEKAGNYREAKLENAEAVNGEPAASTAKGAQVEEVEKRIRTKKKLSNAAGNKGKSGNLFFATVLDDNIVEGATTESIDTHPKDEVASSLHEIAEKQMDDEHDTDGSIQGLSSELDEVQIKPTDVQLNDEGASDASMLTAPDASEDMGNARGSAQEVQVGFTETDDGRSMHEDGGDESILVDSAESTIVSPDKAEVMQDQLATSGNGVDQNLGETAQDGVKASRESVLEPEDNGVAMDQMIDGVKISDSVPEDDNEDVDHVLEGSAQESIKDLDVSNGVASAQMIDGAKIGDSTGDISRNLPGGGDVKVATENDSKEVGQESNQADLSSHVSKLDAVPTEEQRFEDSDQDLSSSESIAVEASVAGTEATLSEISPITEINGDKGFDGGSHEWSDEDLAAYIASFDTTMPEEPQEEVDEAGVRTVIEDERVIALQETVDEMRQALEFVESELQLFNEMREEENDSIVFRVNELEGLLQARADKKREAEEKQKAAAKAKEEELLNAIERTKKALLEAEAALEEEKERAFEITKVLSAAEKQMRNESSAFDQDEARLKAQIRDEKAKVADAETKLRNGLSAFEAQRTSLGKVFQEKITRLAETNARIELERSLFSMKQAELQRNIDEVTAELKATEDEMRTGENIFRQESGDLKKTADEKRAALEELQRELESNLVLFEQTTEDLTMKLIFEKVKVKNLSSELESTRNSFKQEIHKLERTSATNRERLADAEKMLEDTRVQFAEKKENFEKQLADGERIRRLRAKEMSKRYREIREELTNLWQTERRESRRERKVLEENYKTKLSTLEEALPRLEWELREARKASEDLKEQAAIATREKESKLEELRIAEYHYMQKKEERNIAISALEREADDLRVEIAQRDETLTTYKTSFRALLGLSVNLTKKRIGAAGSRLSNVVRDRRLARPRKRIKDNLLRVQRLPVEPDVQDSDE